MADPYAQWNEPGLLLECVGERVCPRVRAGDTGTETARDAGYGFVRIPRSLLSTRCGRSEEHTSELQSRVDIVCRLLLEKKKYHKPSCSSKRDSQRAAFASRWSR